MSRSRRSNGFSLKTAFEQAAPRTAATTSCAGWIDQVVENTQPDLLVH